MSFKLSRQDLKDRDEMVAEVQDKKYKLNQAIESFNNELQDAKDELEEALNDLNGAISDLREFMDQKHTEFQDEYGKKSEKWQEGNRASAVQDWLSTFEVSLEDVDLELPEIINEIDDVEGIAEVEAIESEPSF